MVSSPCWCRYRSTPLACSSCSTPSKSVSERPRRSTLPGGDHVDLLPGYRCQQFVEPGALSRPLAPLMPLSR